MNADDAGRQVAAALVAGLFTAIAGNLIGLTTRQTVAAYLLICAVGAVSRD